MVIEVIIDNCIFLQIVRLFELFDTQKSEIILKSLLYLFEDVISLFSVSGSCERFARSERDHQPPEASGGGHRKIGLSVKPNFFYLYVVANKNDTNLFEIVTENK